MGYFFAIIPTLLLLVASAHNLPLEASNEGVPSIPYEHNHFDIVYKRRIRNGLKDETKRWPNATIPYIIDDGFDENNKTVIHQTMDIYHNLTCVKFVPRTDEEDYISIESNGTGCTSYVGRIGGRQVVSFNIAEYCVQTGVILHELMHALGFEHEHQRTDRDNYIRVLTENVEPQFLFALAKMNEEMNDFGVGYDFNSIMHYTRDAFSKNGQPTIIPLQDDESLKLGEKSFFSEKDILKIRRMYKCEVEELFEDKEDVVPTLSENIRGAYEKFKNGGDSREFFSRIGELFISFLTGLIK